MNERPQAATDGVIVEELEDGAIVYDASTQQAHSLDRTAFRVWSALDGRRTVPEIARETAIAPSIVTATVDELAGRGLIAEDGRVSRRRMLKHTAMVGGAALAAAPVIETVIIPTAAAHASTGGAGGNGGNGGNPPTPPASRLNAYVDYDSSYLGSTAVGVKVTMPPNKVPVEQPTRDAEYYTTATGAQFGVLTYVGNPSFGIQFENYSGPQTYVITVYVSGVMQTFYVLTPGEFSDRFTFTPDTQVTVGTAT